MHHSRTAKIVLQCFLLGCASPLVSISAQAQETPEPYFHGKSMTSWDHALAEPNAEIRVRALAALAQMDFRARVEIPDVARLLNDPEPAVRREACSTLAAFGPLSASAAGPLIAHLSDPDATVRQCVVIALGDIGPEAGSAAGPLGQILQQCNDDALATAAAAALGKLGSAAADPLVGALHSEQPFVRALAADALQSNFEASKAVLPALIEAATDKSSEVRLGVLGAIGNLASSASSAVPALTGATFDSIPAVQAKAALALGEIGPAAAPALPTLKQMLSSTQTEVRINAAGAIWQIAHDPLLSVPPLLASANDADPANRQRTMEWLGIIGPRVPGVLSSLAEALTDHEASVRAQALISLARIGPRAQLVDNYVHAQSRDNDPLIRILATEAMWSIDHRPGDVLASVPSMLRYPDPQVRFRAARLFGQLGPAALAVKRDLQTAMSDNSNLVQVAAAEAIFHITGDTEGTQDKLASIAGNTASRDLAARVEAILALGRLKRQMPEALPILQGQLSDPFPEVRNAATAAMAE